MSVSKTYSDAEKAEYWRKKALEKKKPVRKAYAKRQQPQPVRKVNAPGYISSAGSHLGGVAGGMVAGPPGEAIGRFLGGKLGHLVETVTGFGDYHVAQNSILKGGMDPPQIVNSLNRGSTIIRHREFIGDIVATKAFTISTYPINPGQSTTFPWLSQIASAYEQYRMRGAMFEFKSTSSNALLSSSTSTALGTVIMGTQYDVTDQVWTDKRTMLNHEYSGSVNPSCDGIHLIECKKSQTTVAEMFTRFGAVPTGSDPHLYDLGNFSIATVGMQADGGILGELWVTYEVELFKQQFLIPGYIDVFPFATSYNPPPGNWPVPTGINPWGNPGAGNKRFAAKGYNTLGGYLTTIGGSDNYVFPPNISSGTYLVTYWVQGTTVAQVQPTWTATNCVFAIGGNSIPNNGESSIRNAQIQYFRITGPNAQLTCSTGTIPTAVTQGIFSVQFVSPLLPVLPAY